MSSSGAEANGLPVSGPAVSQSGAFVAFDSLANNLVPGDTNGAADVFVRDVANGLTTSASLTASRNRACRRAGAP